MKVCKHLKLNKNLRRTIPGFRPLGSLALFLFVSSIPVQAVSLQETTTPKTFADWCLNKNNQSVEAIHTINALLRVAETTDCNQASKRLSALTELDLSTNQIIDIKPLSTLTNLTTLDLSDNQIADIKTLSTLTNLTTLDLSNNPIADLKTLSTLTNLRELDLIGNQIADLKPLSTLTNLTTLDLYNNQIADIKPLSTLTNLTTLDLSDNQIADIKT
ncbi:MAG TPA: leucine-rich repeat protein, partial [Cyanophyceae cyanobacterium]